MAHSEASLKKLSKEDVIKLALNYQRKFDSDLAGVRKELSQLKKDFEKLGSELAVSKHVSGMLERGLINIERNARVTDSTLDENALSDWYSKLY